MMNLNEIDDILIAQMYKLAVKFATPPLIKKWFFKPGTKATHNDVCLQKKSNGQYGVFQAEPQPEIISMKTYLESMIRDFIGKNSVHCFDAFVVVHMSGVMGDTFSYFASFLVCQRCTKLLDSPSASLGSSAETTSETQKSPMKVSNVDGAASSSVVAKDKAEDKNPPKKRKVEEK